MQVNGVNPQPIIAQAAAAAAAAPIAAQAVPPLPNAPQKTSFEMMQEALTAQNIDLSRLPPATRMAVTCKSHISDMTDYVTPQGKSYFKIAVERSILIPTQPPSTIRIQDTLYSNIEIPNPPDDKSMTTCKELLHAALQAQNERLQAGLQDEAVAGEVRGEESFRAAITYNNEGTIESAKIIETGKPDPITKIVKLSTLAAPRAAVVFQAKTFDSTLVPSSFLTKIQAKVMALRTLIAHIITPANPPQPVPNANIAGLKAELAKDKTPPTTIDELLILHERKAAESLDVLYRDLQKASTTNPFEKDPARADLQALQRLSLQSKNPAQAAPADLPRLLSEARIRVANHLTTQATRITIFDSMDLLLNFSEKPQLNGSLDPSTVATRKGNFEHLKKQKLAFDDVSTKIHTWIMNGAVGELPKLGAAPTTSALTGLAGYKPYQPGSVVAGATAPRGRNVPGYDVVDPLQGRGEESGNCMYMAVAACCSKVPGKPPYTVQALRKMAAEKCNQLLADGSPHKAELEALLNSSVREYNVDLQERHRQKMASLEAIRTNGETAAEKAAASQQIRAEETLHQTQLIQGDEAAQRLEYMRRISLNKFWGGDAELFALSLALSLNIAKVDALQKEAIQSARLIAPRQQGVGTIYLDFEKGIHYNALLPKP